MNQPVHQRSQRRDKGRITLTYRDVGVLTWTGEQYAVRLDQIQQLLGRDAQRSTQQTGVVQRTTAQRVVRRWLTAGMVHSTYLLAGQPPWIYLTRKGLHEFGLPMRPYVPTVALANHLYWTNQVRLWVEDHYPNDRWISERTLQATRSGTSAQQQHLVDGEVHRSDQGDESIVIAVEVELTVKEAQRSRTIMQNLAERYDGIWYFTNAATHHSVERIIQSFEEEVKERFRVRNLSMLA